MFDRFPAAQPVEALDWRALESCRTTTLVTLQAANDDEAVEMARRAGARLKEIGFVPLRAGGDSFAESGNALTHRHVALIGITPRDSQSLIRWIRKLSAVSPRGHVVVSIRSGPADVAGARVPDRRFNRAGRYARRARHAAAVRWYRAALESARRRGDERGQADACKAVVAHLTRRDAWAEAARVANAALTSISDPVIRAEAAAMRIEILIAQAELTRADALLAAVSAELSIAGASSPPCLDDVRAQLRFWQGRLDEVVATPRTSPSPVGRLLVDAATAFLRRDEAMLTERAESAGALDAPLDRYCHSLLLALAAVVRRESDRLPALVAELGRNARSVRCPRVIRFARALMSEALVVSGVTGLSPPTVGTSIVHRAKGMAELDAGFIEWQAAASVGDRARERRAAATLRASGARVVDVWRWGCADMHLVHAIPILLQVVQDAEDDLATLVAAGAWIRREADAEAVAFLDPNASTVMADGWQTSDSLEVAKRAQDPFQTACEPCPGGVIVLRGVRYAGALSGIVAVRGPAARRGLLIEAVNTVAALCGPALRARIDLLQAMQASPALAGEILGRSPAIAALREAVARAAVTPFAVLVEGESGTGKELVARAIHRLSPRRDRRFVAVNCAALTDELVEAELFGHTRGAFTGAVGPRTGLVEDANGGSLFLDEVSELSPRAQAKLLRVLQEREVRRVGENAPRAVDVRVVAATNRPLAEAARLGGFRDDLLFRLAVVKLQLPPLRARVEDVPILAQACWRTLSLQAGKRAVLGPDAVAALCRHDWPGNVRELQNVMAGLLVLAPERGRVGARHVGQILTAATAAPAVPLQRTRESSERSAVAGALARNGGKRSAAARDLGLTRQGLTKAMKRLGLADGPETGVA